MTECPYCQIEIASGKILSHVGENHPDKLGRFLDEDDKLMWARRSNKK